MRLLRTVTFLITLTTDTAMHAATPPAISVVVNAASFASGTLAPGSLGTIFGSSLASTTAVAPGFPLPTTLGSATVYVNDLPAPILCQGRSERFPPRRRKWGPYPSFIQDVVLIVFVSGGGWSGALRRP
jgi:hypothetical protein